MQDHTRLRHVSGKSLDMVEGWIGSLPFKIEIKSIEKVKSLWYVHFILPEDDLPMLRKFPSVDLK